jgi:hypothetical protein
MAMTGVSIAHAAPVSVSRRSDPSVRRSSRRPVKTSRTSAPTSDACADGARLHFTSCCPPSRLTHFKVLGPNFFLFFFNFILFSLFIYLVLVLLLVGSLH